MVLDNLTLGATSSNALSTGSIDEVFNPLGDFNPNVVDNAATISQETDQAIQNNPGEDPPGKKGKADIYKEYQKMRAKLENFSETAGISAQVKRDPRLAAGAYEYDQYATNVDRYLGYGKSTFNKLGFNPLADNETYYNQNTSMWQDFKRMGSQFGNMFGNAFIDNSTPGGIYSLFSSDELPGIKDLDASFSHAKGTRLGMSTKGGAGGFTNNLLLQSSYSLGIIANVVAEEFAIAGATALLAAPTEGGSVIVGGAATARNLSKLSRVPKLFREGMALTQTATVGRMARSSWGMLTSLNKADHARTFWQAAKDFANPLRGTTKAFQSMNAANGAIHLSNAAKLSKGFGAFYRDIREFNFTLQESRLEAGGVYERFVEEEINRIRKEGREPSDAELTEIYSYADQAAKIHGYSEIPLIFATNRLVFDNMFNFRAVRSLTEAAEQSTNLARRGLVFDATTRTLKELPKAGAFTQAWRSVTNPRLYAATGINYFRANFFEGFQELSQEAAAEGITNYYSQKLNNPEVGNLNMLSGSIYSAFDKQIFSKQGIETFMMGFLMGGVTNKTIGIAKTLATKTSESFFRLTKPEAFAEYKKNKVLLKQEMINSANQILADPEKFFSTSRETFLNQRRANQNMSSAKMNGDNKAYIDSKDEANFDHVFTSLNRGTFGLVIDGMKELSKLSGEELNQAFNLPEGTTNAKEKVADYIKRAEEIKKRYDYFQENFPNPFKPNKFKKGTNEHIQEFISFKAFDDARKAAIASQHGFDRALERMGGLMNELSQDRPVSSAAASDITVLLNDKSLKDEIRLLKQELAGINDESTAEQKALGKQKQKKLEALEDYRNKLKSYRANRQGPKITETGQIELFQDNENENSLQKSYENYIKTIANLNNDIVFNDKVSEAFNKVKDFYELDEDSKAYNKIVNDLLDPTNLYRYYNQINSTLTDLYNNREEITGSSIDKYFSANELNSLMIALGRLGVVIDPSQIQSLVEKGVLPTRFFDLSNNKVIESGDSRFNTIKEIIESFKEIQDETKAEQETEKQEEKPQPVSQPSQQEIQKQPVIDLGVGPELQSKLEDAYNQYIEQTDSDITFEEFVDSSPRAARIKAQFNQQAAQPAEQKTEQKEPVVDTDVVSAIEESSDVVEPVEEVQTPAEKTGTQKAQEVIDSVSSIRDLFDMNSEEAVKLINDGVTSMQLRSMIENKRVELVKKISTNDLQKFDNVTFVDGSTAAYVYTKNGQVHLKTPKDGKGEYTVMSESEFLSKIADVKPAKKLSMQEKETTPEVEITEQDKKVVKSSRDALDSFINDPEKAKKAFDDIMNKKDTDSNTAADDFLDNLGCDT